MNQAIDYKVKKKGTLSRTKKFPSQKRKLI